MLKRCRAPQRLRIGWGTSRPSSLLPRHPSFACRHALAYLIACDEVVAMLYPRTPSPSLLSHSFPVLAASGNFLAPFSPQMLALPLQWKMAWGRCCLGWCL